MASRMRALSTATLQLLLKRGFTQSIVLRSSTGGGHAGGMDLWRKLTYFGAFPAIILCNINVFLDVTSHPHEAPEFIPYEHLRIRTKKFPWGDGNKTLFHNPRTNPLPEGYEPGFGPATAGGKGHH